ncbi:hypothetical protein Tsubulata_020512 [Turnera subulata]|uniref:Protein cereblon n=1 Tax=Turnera subulata TaxID=218843 RepID=A0A9Q0F2G4_9ROSI|nr:hypothetical protein Tsubulata_020512 [Turnera subulata]
MDSDAISEAERHQIEQIRELEFEELQVEEVDDDSSDADGDATDGGATSGELAFNTCLAPLHTYLGEVEDTHHRLAFLDGGALFTFPLFYLEGVVLFPEATLPLRVVQANFISAIERALVQVDAPFTIGVVRVYKDANTRQYRFSTIGTTAEIRQYRRLEDGSLNVLTRGQQRFCLKRSWIDVEGVPCGEVQIIQEDLPLRTPKDAAGKLAPLSNIRSHSYSSEQRLNSLLNRQGNDGSDSESNSEESFEHELSLAEKKIHEYALNSSYGYDSMDESTSSEDDKFANQSKMKQKRSRLSDCDSMESLLLDNERNVEHATFGVGSSSASRKKSCKRGKCQKATGLNQFRRVPRAFWPCWVYRMYDSYCLAERAVDLWKQIVGAPSMEGFVRKPDLLSFHIASKIPVSASTRQELLEIDGISYRLRREIGLLESLDLIQCKNCRSVIARRSDMLVMSTEGPLGAYVNPHGFVHEVMTLNKANGLVLIGRPSAEYSWFPGYAWTIANCSTCERQIGWRFTATKKKLKPQSFWGIRSSQVADTTQ